MRVKFPFLLAAAGIAASLFASGRVVAEDQKAKCPVKGIEFTPTEKTKSVLVNGEKLSFCCGNCPTAFVKDPGKYVKGEMYCPVMTDWEVAISVPKNWNLGGGGLSGSMLAVLLASLG